MKKGDLLNNIPITSLTMEGLCIAKMDGLVIFLEGGAPGDIVHARVTKIKKDFVKASVSAVIKKSKYRIIPFCSHFGLCGGCSWQHLQYDVQLLYKQKCVQDTLERIGGLSVSTLTPILPCSRIKRYRNRLDFTFTNKQWVPVEEFSLLDEKQPGVGFHLPKRFDRVFDVSECFLQPDPSNGIRLLVKKIALDAHMPFFNLKSHEGFLRTLTIRISSSGETMVILQVAYKKMDWINLLLNAVSEHFSAVVSTHYVINGKKNDTFHDLEISTHKGLPYITEIVPMPDKKKSLTFRIGPKSFYQTNSEQTIKLYHVILQLCNPKDTDVVYDLYTGVGSIANVVAGKAGRVIGIELIPAAIEDAKNNSKINHITNTRFFSGDMTTLLNESFFTMHGPPDIIITDPPRGGMSKQVCQAILNASPKKIVYVSCNPATQARDIKILTEKFDIDRIQPLDMFPHTNHVENIVRLTLRDAFCQETQ